MASAQQATATDTRERSRQSCSSLSRSSGAVSTRSPVHSGRAAILKRPLRGASDALGRFDRRPFRDLLGADDGQPCKADRHEQGLTLWFYSPHSLSPKSGRPGGHPVDATTLLVCRGSNTGQILLIDWSQTGHSRHDGWHEAGESPVESGRGPKMGPWACKAPYTCLNGGRSWRCSVDPVDAVSPKTTKDRP
jgi:hypothetical protein